MGYSVTATAFIGVITLSPTEQQVKQITTFCLERHLKFAEIGFDKEDDTSRFCIYVHTLEIEQWGHSAYVNEYREEALNVTEANKNDVRELLELLGEKPQDIHLILSLCGS